MASNIIDIEYKRIWYRITLKELDVSINQDYTVGIKNEEEIFNLNIERDIKNTIQIASMSVPVDANLFKQLDQVKKYDKIEFFVTDTNDQDHRIFIGEFTQKPINMGYNTFEINFSMFDRINILNRNAALAAEDGDDVYTLIQNTLDKALLYTDEKIKLVTFGNTLPLTRIRTSGKVLDMITDVRANYAVWVFGNMDGNIVVLPPSIVRAEKKTEHVIVLDYNEIPMTVNISDDFNNIMAVLAVGRGDSSSLDYGLAVDPIATSLSGNNINYIIEKRLDIIGKQNLEEYALNKLLEAMGNFKIKLNGLPFKHFWDVGMSIQLKNVRGINPNRIFVIERVSHDLSSSNFTTNLTVTGFSVGDIIPEDLLTMTYMRGLDIFKTLETQFFKQFFNVSRK